MKPESQPESNDRPPVVILPTTSAELSEKFFKMFGVRFPVEDNNGQTFDGLDMLHLGEENNS